MKETMRSSQLAREADGEHRIVFFSHLPQTGRSRLLVASHASYR